MASPTSWTWIWASSRRWWRTGKPGVLQSVGLQRVRHGWVTEQPPLRAFVACTRVSWCTCLAMDHFCSVCLYKLHLRPPATVSDVRESTCLQVPRLLEAPSRVPAHALPTLGSVNSVNSETGRQCFRVEPLRYEIWHYLHVFCTRIELNFSTPHRCHRELL